MLLIFCFFSAAVVSPRIWFNLENHSSGARYWLEDHENVSGYVFENELVTDVQREMLGTTNIINGSFIGSGGAKVTVFLASWFKETGQSLVLEPHTPDICWRGVGWSPIETGQPSTIHLNLFIHGDNAPKPGSEGVAVSLPFECRVFRSPQCDSEELVVWCALASGRLLPELVRFWPEQKSQTNDSPRSDHVQVGPRRLVGQQFWHCVQERKRLKHFQFVRFSMPFKGDWAETIKQIQSFGPQWINLRSDRI